ncbi:TATA box-binding protein-associated factor RNA polymerase I subunit B-like isoform X2 [Corticium candelabrum]|uniref:TATA box-binding protein-associated factor RNA polymerase I subunit B-like isoform X2 n=1 Tax=Corticium candelabrum TaxID=121492 RepID=UPI002E2638A1|nr:TATA box-binding protein-associated factor RNA polymerase I subunit B-like isoform X2 [Corticium candelabrum]
MPLCPHCDSQTFDVTDGLFFCSQCGTQSQDVRQEEDYNYGLTTLSVGRSSRFASKKSKKHTKNETKRCTVWEWNEAFQWLLKKQVEALIGMGFDRKLKEAVAQLWFAYLRKLNIAFTDSPETEVRRLFANISKKKLSEHQERLTRRAHRKSKITSLSQSALYSDSSDEETTSQQTTQPAKKPRVTFSDAVKQSDASSQKKQPCSSSESEVSDREPLTPYECSDTECPSGDDAAVDMEIPVALRDAMKDGLNKTYKVFGCNRSELYAMCADVPVVVCYVALLSLGQTVVEIDIVRWLRSQKLPYLDMMSCLPQHMQVSVRGVAAVFKPYVALEPVDLGRAVKRLILGLNVPRSCFPSVDCEAVCHRFASELLLPEHVRNIISGLLRIHTPDCILPFFYSIGSLDSTGVGGMCMAVVVMAMRMCYGLDGEREFKCPSQDLDLAWCEWLQLYSQHLVKQHRLSSPTNILGLAKDCRLYLTAWDYRIPKRPRGIADNAAKRVPRCAEIFRKLSEVCKPQRTEKEQDATCRSEMKRNLKPDVDPPASRYHQLRLQRVAIHPGCKDIADSYRLFLSICASLIEIRKEALHSDVAVQEQLYITHFENDPKLKRKRFRSESFTYSFS